MSTHIGAQKPAVSFVSREFAERIIEEAEDVLEKTGILVESEDCLELLGNGGGRIDREKKKAFLPKRLIEESLKSVPSSIKLYDRNDNLKATLEGNESCFNPGSATTRVLDSNLGKIRDALTKDQINIVKLVDALDNMAVQSTVLYPNDVPKEITAQFRYFLCLRYGTKPIYGGPCSDEGNQSLKDLLVTVRGSEKALREKPLNLQVVVVMPPLKWSEQSCHFLTQFAQSGTPVVISPGSALGVTAPITLAGALVQHIAELLSGMVITQLSNPGAPIVFGGASPAMFDMRYGTVCMSAVETMLASMAFKAIANFLEIPTGDFVVGSEAKYLDSQSGLESGIGAVLGTLAGINLLTGSGMLNTYKTSSLEKLVIDNEICGMALRLAQGITPRGERLAEDLFTDKLYEDKHFLLSTATMRWMREEYYYPGPVISRQTEETWEQKGATTAEQRAKEEVKRILGTHQPEPLDKDVDKELVRIMTKDAKKYGMSKLPLL